MLNDINELQNVYHVNQLLLQESVYIYGTGAHAKSVLIELQCQGIEVVGFIDNVVGKKEFYLKKPLYDENNFKNRETAIIIASVSWQKIFERLSNKGFKNLFVDKKRYMQVEVNGLCIRSIGKYVLKKEVLYICCPAGLGDTLYIAAYCKSVKAQKKYPNKVCLITKSAQACIGNFFEAVDEVIASDELVDILEEFSVSTQTWYLENYIYGHIKKNKCQTFEAEYYDFPDRNMVSLYKKQILGLSDDAEMELLDFHKEINDLLKMEESSVILMPYAKTSQMLPMCFWESLVKLFHALRYVVYTNVKDNSEAEIFGSKRLEESVYNMAAISKNVNLVIGIRSGICDVLAMAGANLVVINTDKTFEEEWNLNMLSDNVTNLQCFSQKQQDEVFEKIRMMIEKRG